VRTSAFIDGSDDAIIAALHWGEASSEKKQSASEWLSRRWPRIFRSGIRREFGLSDARRSRHQYPPNYASAIVTTNEVVSLISSA
jgi:hypothetical protein